MIAKPLIRYRIPRYSRKSASSRVSSSFLRSTSIGILFSSDDLEKHKAIKSFVQEMESIGKKVDVITFLDKGKDNHEFLFKYYTKKDLNFWGNFTNEDVDQFTEIEFDFLFCFDFKTSLYQRYILSMSKAKCRIGHFGTIFQAMLPQ